MSSASASSSLRQTVQLAAQRFKAGWAELGKLLVQVRDSASFSDWGYPSFEAYCAEELHIKKPTALKLVRSYSFLARREPQMARERRDDETSVRAPAFEVVEVLADAEDRGQLSDAEYQRIRESIWNPERPASDLRRELVERYPRPQPAPPTDRALMRRLAASAQKLAADLKAARKVPRAIVDRAEALAEEVGELAQEHAEVA
jgi:hypothetical protein